MRSLDMLQEQYDAEIPDEIPFCICCGEEYSELKQVDGNYYCYVCYNEGEV